jgi:hypothetical protein
LFDLVRDYFVECLNVDIDAYITDERSQVFSLESLRSRHAPLVDDFRIPGLPSDDLEGEGTCYRGLELAFGPDGWSATLWEPYCGDELFLPECWDGETLDEILDESPWTREELVEILVDSDPRWKAFLDKDFSVQPEPMPKQEPHYKRQVANNDWEREESVLVTTESKGSYEDLLVLGRRPVAHDDGEEYYMFLRSMPRRVVRHHCMGYGEKIIYLMNQRLKENLAKQHISFEPNP